MDDYVARLRRWEQAGGIWRVMGRSADGAVAVEMETCAGEPMDQFTSGDPELLAYLGDRDMSDGSLDGGPFFHGTKASLQPGALIEPGRDSNFDADVSAAFVYMSATMDAAIWGAELAIGDSPGHVYRVEPTGTFEHDPNLTDTRFRGNRTRSYRSSAPLRVVEEVADWEGHRPEVLQEMRDNVARLKAEGMEAINE